MTRILMLSAIAAAVLGIGFCGCTAVAPPSSGSRAVSNVRGDRDGGTDWFREAEFTGTSRMRVAAEPLQPLGSEAPFAWQFAGYTAAGAELQTAASGPGGFRTVVVGSIGGDDPAAVRLTEQLARYLHENSRIVGGVQATFIRTLNPDGLQRGGHRNADGIYLNRRFPAPRTSGPPPDQIPPEIRCLLGLLKNEQPHRVIHIRTVPAVRPMVAASDEAMDSVREIADWLNADLRNLPDSSARGTMESWVAGEQIAEMVTFGIPRATPVSDVWTLYGDGALSLLLDGDTISRRMARERQGRQSADRRRWWDDTRNPASRPMFMEDFRGRYNARNTFP